MTTRAQVLEGVDDDEQVNGELRWAAVHLLGGVRRDVHGRMAVAWPWLGAPVDEDPPAGETSAERRRREREQDVERLRRAAALVAAEIERVNRLEEVEGRRAAAEAAEREGHLALARDQQLGKDCEECGARVLAFSNGVYFDPTPVEDGGGFMMPAGGLFVAAFGRAPEGLPKFDLHDHQPVETEEGAA